MVTELFNLTDSLAMARPFLGFSEMLPLYYNINLNFIVLSVYIYNFLSSGITE
jgi:hypothetical protein